MASMLSLKRKHDELEDSEEDEPSYGKQILPVANLPADFNDQPLDGMQYLFMVRRAARQLPDVAHVPNPFAKLQSSSLASELDSSENGGPSYLPSEEWRELFEYRFFNFRKNFNQPTIHVGPTNDGSRRLMPEKKDRDMWWAFLEGKPEAEWMPVHKSKGKSKNQATRGLRAWADEPPLQQEHDNPIYELSPNNDEGEVEEVLRMDPADSLPSPAGTPVPLDFLEAVMQPSSSDPTAPSHTPRCDIYKPREPTTRLLRLIDGKTALHLLMYFTHWIQLYLKSPEQGNYVPTESHARWIFALFSRIDDQISADDTNLLRNLARACLKLLEDTKKRLSLSETSNNLRMGEISCWFIVTLVADVWRQRDLWTDAETILAKCWQ